MLRLFIESLSVRLFCFAYKLFSFYILITLVTLRSSLLDTLNTILGLVELLVYRASMTCKISGLSTIGSETAVSAEVISDTGYHSIP